MNDKQPSKFCPFFSDYQEQTPMPILTDQIKSKIQTQNQIKCATFYIILEKFLNNKQITDIELQQLSERQRDILHAISDKAKSKSKRPDQCHKLFYKRAFKYSQKKYFKKRKNKKRIMSQFYHYHFDQTVVSMGNSITAFYHPNKKSKPGLQKGQKTFNLSYVRLLLKSKSFRIDAKEYHRVFVSECIRQRTKKMRSFIESLQRITKRDQKDPTQLMKYLQSSQCKIPWTLEQIEKASQIANKELDKLEECSELGSQVDPEKPKFKVKQIEAQEVQSEEFQQQQSSFFDSHIQLPIMF